MHLGYRKGENVKELLEAVGQQKQNFESIPRPQLTVASQKLSSGTPKKCEPEKGLFVNVGEDDGDNAVKKPDEHTESSHYIKVEVLTPQAKVKKLESRTGQFHRDSAEEINDWEFD